MRKYSCSGPQVVNTRSAFDANSLSTRPACFDSASIERRSGVFLSSASPVQLTKAVGMTRVTLPPLPLTCSQGGLVGSHAVYPPRFEGRAHAARREARGIRLAADQFLAAEFRYRAPVGGRSEKGVVLLGRNARQRLEPVSVMGCAVLDGPVLQRASDRVGGREIERLSAGDGGAQGAVDRRRQPGLLHLVVEHQLAELFGCF